MNSKEYFFDAVVKEIVGDDTQKVVRVMELGCGTARYIPNMLQKYPNLEYVGVEPITASFNEAQKNLAGQSQAKLIHQLGYEEVEGCEKGSFDIVISFSVLEHVKQLGKFMKLGHEYAKSGGLVVHRYDLGHALYPIGVKDWVHVTLGNVLPQVLPERKFVRYVPMKEVEDFYEKFGGLRPHKYTYHQMPSQKKLQKGFDKLSDGVGDEAMEEVHAWEFKHAEDFHQLPLQLREKLFPTVAVWGKKQ